MWKIFITYDDKSKVTLTGKHKDIPKCWEREMPEEKMLRKFDRRA